MKKLIFILIFFINISHLNAIIVGNPSDPKMLTNGIFFNTKIVSFKAGYLYYNVYSSDFEDKFKSLMSTPSDVRQKIFASVLTLNFYKFFDISAILGTTNLEVDSIIDAKREFAYGFGIKTFLVKSNNFDISIDGKYFTSILKPSYFLVADETRGNGIYSIVDNFEQSLEEYQLSIAASYNTNFLIPYIGSTFLYYDIMPSPKIGKLALPAGGEFLFETNDSLIKNFWGAVLGISFTNLKKEAFLTLEGRFFDQNAFGFFGTIRF